MRRCSHSAAASAVSTARRLDRVAEQVLPAVLSLLRPPPDPSPAVVRRRATESEGPPSRGLTKSAMHSARGRLAREREGGGDLLPVGEVEGVPVGPGVEVPIHRRAVIHHSPGCEAITCSSSRAADPRLLPASGSCRAARDALHSMWGQVGPDVREVRFGQDALGAIRRGHGLETGTFSLRFAGAARGSPPGRRDDPWRSAGAPHRRPERRAPTPRTGPGRRGEAAHRVLGVTPEAPDRPERSGGSELLRKRGAPTEEGAVTPAAVRSCASSPSAAALTRSRRGGRSGRERAPGTPRSAFRGDLIPRLMTS